MNWGVKIVLVFIAFVTGILFMVFKSYNQKTDLVTTDYYAKELQYQEKIDKMKRVQALSAPVKFEVKGSELIIMFPKDFSGKLLTGEVVLYYPADKNKDVKENFSIQDEPLKIAIPSKNRGLHWLQLSWKEGDITYYFEKKFFI